MILLFQNCGVPSNRAQPPNNYYANTKYHCCRRFGGRFWGAETTHSRPACGFTCPECHGFLVSIKDGERSGFRCHTGHAFCADALLASVTESIEDSLWNAASKKACECYTAIRSRFALFEKKTLS